jgi:hypothetical protein
MPTGGGLFTDGASYARNDIPNKLQYVAMKIVRTQQPPISRSFHVD